MSWMPIYAGMASLRSAAVERAVADVFAELHAVEADLLRHLVGALGGDPHLVAQRGDAQHTAAARDDPAALLLGAGVEHVEILLVPGQAVDLVALARRLRIAGRREHDAQRRAPVPFRLHRVERALDAVLHQLEEIALEPQQDRL